MTSASALTGGAALLLFQNLREGMQDGRIADLNTALTEVDAAIAKLNSGRLPEEPTHTNDLMAKLLLEFGSLQEKVTKCEAQLADFRLQANVLNEDTIRTVARTEASGLLTEYQRKRHAKMVAAVEEMKASDSTAPHPCADPFPFPSPAEPVSAHTALHLCGASFPSPADTSNVPALPHMWVAPLLSPVDPTSRPAPSRVAVVSFPGGPRTITIHPPDSPGYQSIIRDEKGDVIIDFRRTKPLRREGAFRGPLEDIDWREITRVCGRSREQSAAPTVPPSPRCPDRSQPSNQTYLPTSFRGPSDIIVRQRQLSTSMQTDSFGRVLAPEYLRAAKSPSLPTGMSSSSLPPSSQVFQFSSSSEPDITSTSPSTPPSPSDERAKKRTRDNDDDEGGPLASGTAREHSVLPANPRTVKEPITPTHAKHEQSRPPEGLAKRKKLRPSVSSEGLSTTAASHTFPGHLVDLTRTV